MPALLAEAGPGHGSKAIKLVVHWPAASLRDTFWGEINMAVVEVDIVREPGYRGSAGEIEYERWQAWPVNWSAVLVGALAVLAVGMIVGLVAIAVGGHLLDPQNRIVDL